MIQAVLLGGGRHEWRSHIRRGICVEACCRDYRWREPRSLKAAEQCGGPAISSLSSAFPLPPTPPSSFKPERANASEHRPNSAAIKDFRLAGGHEDLWVEAINCSGAAGTSRLAELEDRL